MYTEYLHQKGHVMPRTVTEAGMVAAEDLTVPPSKEDLN